jgi:hypothetical protein
VVAKAPSSREGRSVVPKTPRRRSVRRGWGGDQCVLQLTRHWSGQVKAPGAKFKSTVAAQLCR